MAESTLSQLDDAIRDNAFGTGPRLQMLTDDPGTNAAVEQAFMR